MRPIETMLIDNLSKGKKEVILQKPYEFSEQYNVIIDNVLEALVIIIPFRGWEVRPQIGSWFTDDDCDVILKTVLNLENPNF